MVWNILLKMPNIKNTIISMYIHYIWMMVILLLLVHRISYSMFKKNTIINKFEFLKNAYPFISRSRPLVVKEQQ